MRRLLPALLLLLAFPGTAAAALPSAGKSYSTHDHATKGANWHVEVEMSKKSRKRVETLVLYAETCNATVAEFDVPVGDDGSLAGSGKYTPGTRDAVADSGTWTLTSSFTSSTRLEGTFQLVQPGCDSGVLAFVAKTGGDGHKGHAHGGNGHGANHGPNFPNFRRATRRARGEARALWRESRRLAKTRFPTYQSARRQGFNPFTESYTRPLIFHVRSKQYDYDGVVLNPNRVESLVYWWPKRGRPVLVAFMFRAPAGPVPREAKGMLIWHQHFNSAGKLGTTQMTHVWNVKRWSKYSVGNCLPIDELERSVKGFRYARPASIPQHESQPCPNQKGTDRAYGKDMP